MIEQDVLFRALAAHAAIMTAGNDDALFYRHYEAALECITSWALFSPEPPPSQSDTPDSPSPRLRLVHAAWR
jgi:hypothetical protein